MLEDMDEEELEQTVKNTLYNKFVGKVEIDTIDSSRVEKKQNILIY